MVRAAQAIAQSLTYRLRYPEAIDALNRALTRLSSTAAAERASLHALLTPISLFVSPPDTAWGYMEQAVTTAERIGDPSLTGRVLQYKAWAHTLCPEPEAALTRGNRRFHWFEKRPWLIARN